MVSTVYSTDLGLLFWDTFVRQIAISENREHIAISNAQNLYVKKLDSDRHFSILLTADADLIEKTCNLESAGLSSPFIAFAPGGDYLACINEIHIADSAQASGWRFHIALDADPREFACSAFAPDGNTLATGMRDGRICFWDVATGKQVDTWRVGETVNELAFSPDATRLASSVNHSIVIWDISKRMRERSLDRHTSVVTSIAFSRGTADVSFGEPAAES